jgi:hypothetical protein
MRSPCIEELSSETGLYSRYGIGEEEEEERRRRRKHQEAQPAVQRG